VRIAFFITFTILLAGTGLANNLDVPGTYTNIQDAINAATNGDTVVVAAGTYNERLDYLGKKITVISVSGPEFTIIDGDSLGSVVSFINGEKTDSVLEGFTVTNGWAQNGGGVYCNDTSPTIQGNWIKKNHGVYGGGIFSTGAAPIIKANEISGNDGDHGGGICCRVNSAPLIKGNKILNNCGADTGGGIECYDNSTPTIIENVIESNYNSHGFSYGGGIHCRYSSSAKIIKNLIRNNSSLHSGGGIYDKDSSPLISKNIIIDNTTTNYGGGVASVDGSSAVIKENIIAHNHANLDGGGVYTWYTDTTTITGCTIVGNSCGVKGGGLYVGAWCYDIVTNTILWDNTGGNGDELYVGEYGSTGECTIDYCDVDGAPTSVVVSHGILNWGGHIYDVNPLFVDEAGRDYHLTLASLLKDRGDNYAPSLSQEDFEMDKRIANGTVDIGADEYSTHLYYTGDAIPGNAVNLRVIGDPGKQTLLFYSSGVLTTPKLIKFGYLYLNFPVFFLPLGAIPSSGLIELPVAIPPNFPTPAAIYMQGIVLDKLTNLCELNIHQ